MGFHLKFGNAVFVRGIDCFKVPSGALGSAAWAARRSQAHVVETVYELEFTMCERYEHSQKMPWPGIKFTDFSRVLGKLIKFLDFSRAGKHFFVFPALSPNSRTAGNHAYGITRPPRVNIMVSAMKRNSTSPEVLVAWCLSVEIFLLFWDWKSIQKCGMSSWWSLLNNTILVPCHPGQLTATHYKLWGLNKMDVISQTFLN